MSKVTGVHVINEMCCLVKLVSTKVVYGLSNVVKFVSVRLVY